MTSVRENVSQDLLVEEIMQKKVLELAGKLGTGLLTGGLVEKVLKANKEKEIRESNNKKALLAILGSAITGGFTMYLQYQKHQKELENMDKNKISTEDKG